MAANRRSLSLKLTLAFLVVGILGAVLVAALVNWQTRRQFDTLVHELYQDELTDLQDQLRTYYQAHGTWDGIGTTIFAAEPPAPAPGGPEPDGQERPLPVVLVDGERRVVFGNHHYQPGQQLSPSLIANALPIEVEGETVGWLTLASFSGDRGDFADTPEATFLANLNRSTVWSALGAGAVALLLGIWLARTISHPVRELKAATAQVARGELGAQVPVRSTDEIGELAASFNQMSADLARANELRQQMTADIAHDLRTPLSVIQGYTEALDDGKLPGNAEIYRAMHKQVQHLTRLVEDLRTLSLADAGQLPMQPQVVAPRDLLEHSALAFLPQAEQQQVSLHLDVPDGLPDIKVDPDRLLQVLGNLISNALRHTPPGGEIRLATARQAHHLLLQVQDTGTGIAAVDLPHVFDRFYRGDKARGDSGESGLGLAIARSIVEAHGGRIAATSTPGSGTTFTITLPLS